MAEWCLGISTVMIVFLVLSDIFGNRYPQATQDQFDSLRKGLQLEDDRKREKVVKHIEAARAECLTALGEKYQILTKFNADVANELDKREKKAEETFLVIRKEFEKFTKEYGVLEVRQRTMEKKILATSRTLNVVFNGAVPVQQVPIITEKKKTRGAGRSALIPETTI